MVLRDEASAPFFDALARGELTVRQCSDCGELAAPQARACPVCSATEHAWTAVEGSGVVVSWTVRRDRGGEILAVGGIVELAEGPWLRARLAVEPCRLSAGLPVTVLIERRDGEEPVPVFTL
ncbi:hypothetical protein SAMN05421504_113133 [Amycolatopsis xylanica]|uniref:ChsH2 rubredoxin-like zinc ribbon domain-containing protein n=1 Tax=Amycolatopsis xylanica TaxID=589385 RepID=A0A1H3SDS5_9PSEU|nr:zinc ribbon domain-containing protein [Amycolatopsis xylanica]SDZ35887.1 hypothetical protein SAMN05421504_113133 [Amycolatopsis xylanica]